MSEATYIPPETPDQGNGKAGSGESDWPRVLGPERSREPFRPPDRQQMERDIPSLHLPAAMPIVRDRWERLVTTIEIPTSAQEIWRALTDPADLKLWLALCHGSLEALHRD